MTPQGTRLVGNLLITFERITFACVSRYRFAVVGPAISLILLLLLSCGTDRYQLLERKDGTLVRLDRRSGQIVLLDNGSMTVVPEPTSASDDAVLGVRKRWPDEKIPIGDSTLTASLQTLWRGGNVFYRLTVNPGKRLQSVLRRSSNYGQHFILHLEDLNNFQMLGITVPVSDMNQTVNAKGEVEAYEGNGSVQATREIYASVSGVRIGWKL